MLTTNLAELPLPPAVMTRLESADGEHDVIESEVFLEIENAAGRSIVTQRKLKGAVDKNLIRVHYGPVLSQPSFAALTEDFAVNLAGTAQRDFGFHRFLASFLSWELPSVSDFDGSERPLYLQCLFPYFVVEQTRGWSTVQPPLPTHFRIRDVHKRAVEFLLRLDANRLALRRQEIFLQKARVETEWSSRFQQVNDFVDSAAGSVQSLPKTPTSTWPPEISPSFVVPSGKSWIGLAQRLADNRSRYDELMQQELPRVHDIVTNAQNELDKAERELREKQALLARLLDALEMEQDEVKRVDRRLKAIDEDIQRNKDSRTVQKLRSDHGSTLSAGICPICHQAVHDSLIELGPDQGVMTVEQNIEFLTEQRRTFQLVLENSRRIEQARGQQTRSTNEEISLLRNRIRSLRQTLTSDERLPSAAAIRDRLELEASIQQDEQRLKGFHKLIDSFDAMSARWRQIQKELLSLPANDTSQSDRDKLEKWSGLIRQQLIQYGFRSFPADRVSVSTDTYRPIDQGFDVQTRIGMEAEKNTSLQTSVSASDLIRTIWSYLNGMLELARSTSSNHPGCMIFDEPRQHSMRDVSFTELLRRGSESRAANQQVIFFTSETLDRLKVRLERIPHELIELHGRVLQSVPLDGATLPKLQKD